MSGGSTPLVTFETFKPIFDVFTDMLPFSTLVSIIVGAIGAVLVYVVSWWGLRKVAKIAKSGVFRGKLRI